MELGTLIRIWLRRLPHIVATAVVCAGAAWAVARGNPTVYEMRLSFVLRPADELRVEEANRAAGTLADRDSAITQTIVGLLDSGADRGSIPPATTRTITLRPGSTIIDAELQGGDTKALVESARSYSATAPQVVSRSYRIYELEPLMDGAPPSEVASTLSRTVAVAFVLGCALGLGIATLEHQLRSGGRDPALGASDAERLKVVQREGSTSTGGAEA